MTKRGVRGIVAAGVVSAALLVVAPAWGSCGHKKTDPAIAQYIEVIPTSCGSQPVSQRGVKLSRGLALRIGHGPDSTLLRRLAATRAAQLKLRGKLLHATGRNPLGAAVGTTGGSMIALVIIMAVLAVLAFGGVLYRRRMTR